MIQNLRGRTAKEHVLQFAWDSLVPELGVFQTHRPKFVHRVSVWNDCLPFAGERNQGSKTLWRRVWDRPAPSCNDTANIITQAMFDNQEDQRKATTMSRIRAKSTCWHQLQHWSRSVSQLGNIQRTSKITELEQKLSILLAVGHQLQGNIIRFNSLCWIESSVVFRYSVCGNMNHNSWELFRLALSCRHWRTWRKWVTFLVSSTKNRRNTYDSRQAIFRFNVGAIVLIVRWSPSRAVGATVGTRRHVRAHLTQLCCQQLQKQANIPDDFVYALSLPPPNAFAAGCIESRRE